MGYQIRVYYTDLVQLINSASDHKNETHQQKQNDKQHNQRSDILIKETHNSLLMNAPASDCNVLFYSFIKVFAEKG